MTQTVCSRCIKPLTDTEKRRHTMLCKLCEPAWKLAFESKINELAPLLHEDMAECSHSPASSVTQQPH